MNAFAVYALAGALNALIVCSALSLFIKKLNISFLKQTLLTFVIYVMFAFVLSSGGHGIFDLDMSVFNLPQFLLYFCGGVAVCTTKYFVTVYSKPAENKSKAKSKARR